MWKYIVTWWVTVGSIINLDGSGERPFCNDSETKSFTLREKAIKFLDTLNKNNPEFKLMGCIPKLDSIKVK